MVIEFNSVKTPIDILKFWHMVEFFVPFDLDEVCAQENATYKLTPDLLTRFGNEKLPWLSERARKLAGCNPLKNYKYNLYLLPFDKREITQLSHQIFPLEQKQKKYFEFEFEEKLNDEGETCFAKLSIDSSGKPDWEKISVSTLPWALGRLTQRCLNELTAKDYQGTQLKLHTALNMLASHLKNKDSELIFDFFAEDVLTASGLLYLLDILQAWAGFKPDHEIAVVIEVNETIRPNVDEQSVQCLTAQITIQAEVTAEQDTSLVQTTEQSTSNTSEEKAEDETTKNEHEYTFDILNSFYIEDLEKVINDLQKCDHPSLQAYMMGKSSEYKNDLFVKENHAIIFNKLLPQYMNQGKWPASSSHYMSLMQQFAINECFHPTQKEMLFSVNGPPGTGKTTLLQDIIAENISKRARVLAEFDSVAATFDGRLSINFSDRESRNISVLNKRLTGFEMVVASTNNAAVENVSRELPLQSKLADAYQLECSYLKSVAAKVCAEHKNNKIKKLHDEEQPWGLVSIALGNSKNRNQFCDRVFFKAEKTEEETEQRVKQGEYLTIWEWKTHYKGPSFLQAKEKFLIADNLLTRYFNDLKQLVKVSENLNNLSAEIESLGEDLKNLAKNKQVLSQQRDELKQRQQETSERKDKVHVDFERHKQNKPSFFARLFITKKARAYKKQYNALLEEWNQEVQQEIELKQKIRALDHAVNQLQKSMTVIEKEFTSKQQEVVQLKERKVHLLTLVDGTLFPPQENDLEKAEAQLKAFWQSEKLNELRAKLFICALQLHEAWLAEALRSGLFIDNLFAISRFLTNKRPVTKEYEIYIWQSLFMWIPVISSTFASIGRQFKNIGRNTLGWLLIDEAGQAIPQAAVGAMWRAQQTLVVGDPLQIEPVLTTPPNLIKGLAEHCLKQDFEKWLPTLTSVQVLADDANSMGAYHEVAGRKHWIGCPLRVHRRCLDPMFSIANKIAYDNKMLNTRVDKTIISNFPLGESCWFDVKGQATDKQYVQAQGQLLLKLFAKFYDKEGKLPNIFIITPFKRVKYNIQKLLLNVSNWSQQVGMQHRLPSESDLRKWCSKHIGTVHTFQGKEASTVIFVLGVDVNNIGAANWASGKPNLLNVALTRAQDRIYIIGDFDLWIAKPYFCELAQWLNPASTQTSSHSSIEETLA